MTNRLAILFFVLVLAAFAADIFLNGGAASLFLAKKFAALVDYLQFWR